MSPLQRVLNKIPVDGQGCPLLARLKELRAYLWSSGAFLSAEELSWIEKDIDGCLAHLKE